MADLFASTATVSGGNSFLTQQEESSLYQPNATPFASYQSPIQTRLQREIAHRSAKNIASRELSLSVRDEKGECPASLVRLRFQEHRFLVDELYQHQDSRKELEQKFALQTEELASCLTKLKRLEGHKKLDQYVEEINKLKAYGESLEQDNHLTLQRLDQETDRHADLQGKCKALLSTAELDWQDDHCANLAQLDKFARLYADLGNQVEKERDVGKTNRIARYELAEQLRDLQHKMQEVLEVKLRNDRMQAELNAQCQSVVESCGLEWCEDLETNLLILQDLQAKHTDIVAKQRLLMEKYHELSDSHTACETENVKLKAEKEVLEAQDRNTAGIQTELTGQKLKVASLEEQCARLRADYGKTTELYQTVDMKYGDLKRAAVDMLDAVGLPTGTNTSLVRQLRAASNECVELRKKQLDMQSVQKACQGENSLIRQRELTQLAEHDAKCSSIQAEADSWESQYKALAKAHAQLECQWMELREWRMPEPDLPDPTEHPKLWGIQVKQLVALHDEIIADLEDYCSCHDFNIEDNECVHVCRRQPCKYDGDHRNVKMKRRIEVTDRTTLQPMVPNMYIVVDRYLKPQCMAKGPNMSFSKLTNPGGMPITAFVSHTWLEPFRDFVTTLQIALDPDEAIWVCSFALPQTQKQGIADMLNTDLNKVPFSLALKHAAKLIVVLDKGLQILKRAWCIYEIEKARRWGIPTLLWAHQPGILMALKRSIDSIDFRKATATYPGDRDAIARAIEEEGGYDILNEHMRRCIRDRAAICEMAVSEMKGMMNLNNEELLELRRKAADGVTNSNQSALDDLQASRKELEKQLEAAEIEGRTEGRAALKQLLRKLQLDEAALLQEKNLLLQMAKDVQEMRNKDNTEDVVSGVSSKLLGVLEPMLEQFMIENRRSLHGVRQSVKKGNGATLEHAVGSHSLGEEPLSPRIVEVDEGDHANQGSSSGIHPVAPQPMPLERATTEPAQ